MLDAATAAVCASKHDAEERFQARQITCNNADVGLDNGPDGEVARVPEPVAGSTVCGDVRGFDYGGCRGALDESDVFS